MNWRADRGFFLLMVHIRTCVSDHRRCRGFNPLLQGAKSFPWDLDDSFADVLLMSIVLDPSFAF